MLEVVRLAHSRAIVYNELLDEAGIGNEERLKRRVLQDPNFLQSLGIIDDDDIADMLHHLNDVDLNPLDTPALPFKTTLVFAERGQLSSDNDALASSLSSSSAASSLRTFDLPSFIDPSSETGRYKCCAVTPPTAEVLKKELSASQAAALDQVMRGSSVFITGAAGTGKSHLLNVMKTVFYERGVKAAFTAPTGVAACHLGGLTLHAWAGIGTADASHCDLQVSPKAATRWRRTDILVIDEVSMLGMELFDMLSVLGSQIREDPRPFGGLQIVLCGDFFQLPPVKSEKFCFESIYWDQLISNEKIFYLEFNFRQQNFQFQQLLNDLRIGVICESSKLQLLSRVNALLPCDRGKGISPTLLCPKNSQVNAINNSHLDEINSEDVTYDAVDGGDEHLLEGIRAPKKLRLKVKAQVMLLKNLSVTEGLVNGTCGIVKSFARSRFFASSTEK